MDSTTPHRSCPPSSPHRQPVGCPPMRRACPLASRVDDPAEGVAAEALAERFDSDDIDRGDVTEVDVHAEAFDKEFLTSLRRCFPDQRSGVHLGDDLVYFAALDPSIGIEHTDTASALARFDDHGGDAELEITVNLAQRLIDDQVLGRVLLTNFGDHL